MIDPDISTRDALALLHTPEAPDRLSLDRRRFLQLVGMGMGAGLVAGGGSSLLDHFALGHDATAWAAGPVGATDGILVVIGMFGGNDGLNSLVPTGDGNYYAQHGTLAIPAGQALPIANGYGLHPNLPELKRFWDAGQMAVVRGVGYPNPDLSHFNSMGYWMGGQVGGIVSTGWLGRWLDGYLGGGKDLFAGAEIGWSVPLHLIGAAQRGTVVPTSQPTFGAETDPRELRKYAAIRDMRTSSNGALYGAVAQAFVDQLDLAAALSPHFPADDALPDAEIVAKLEIAARMINANLGFRVLTCGWGDFDSHANEASMHPARMQELNDGITRFFQLLDPAWTSRVTVMTYSEFGRTSWSDGEGTDHGTLAPHFVIGQNVKGGLYGSQPSLAGLDRWDRMAFTTGSVDFRSYYASILDGWLGGGSSTILGGNYENLGLFARGPGKLPDGSTAPSPATITPPSYFVPLAPKRVLDTRDGTGGLPIRPMNPNERIRVPIAGVGGVPGSGVTAVVANVTAAEATSPNYMTVYPGSTARPFTSNLNAGPGRPVPNLVVMGVGADGRIEVFNSAGTTHCIVDVFGYFTTTSGDRFTAVSPARLFDTRTGQGIRAGKLAGTEQVDVQVAGLAGVPASGASAVVMNLTVTQTESPGWVRASPAGTPSATSNVNFVGDNTVPNLVICKLGTGGKITIDGFGQATHVLGDVFGYFGGAGQLLRALPPQRVLDTREGTGAPKAQATPGTSIKLAVGGRAQVPANAAAVVMNVTATNVTGATHVTVWPDGSSQPGTSNLNVFAGQTVANLVICRLGTGGALRLASAVADCDLVADVLGYFIA